MKRLVLTLAAASALAAAAPSFAQYSVNTRGSVALSAQIAQLEDRFQVGLRTGTISVREERMLRPQLRYLRQLHRRYSSFGMSVRERADLQQRIRVMRRDMRFADGGHAYYDRQWAYADDYPYYGQGGPYYGQGGPYYDQGGPYYGQGGPFEDADACVSSDGIHGILDSVLGTRCLRVGDRVRGNLYAVPSQYRDEYFDGAGLYYRSDGRLIYEIDAATNTVVRSFAITR